MPGRSRAAADRKNRRIEERWVDTSWRVWETCWFCGTSILVNNYDDRTPKVPTYRGKVCCPWCKSRHSNGVLDCAVFVDQLATLGPSVNKKKVVKVARRLQKALAHR